MKHFYDHNDDNLRSKLTDHEFGKLPGAWDDMEKRLDQFSNHSGAASASWSAWFVIGAMLVATTVGIMFYQWETPFGKNNNQVLANQDNLGETIVSNKTKTITLPSETKSTQKTASNHKNAHQVAQTTISSPVVANSTVKALTPAVIANNKVIIEDVDTKEDNNQEVIIEEPGIAPNPEMEPDGQRPDNNNNSFPVYTRRTEVIHAFSKSNLKWKTTKMPTISPSAVRERRSSLIDTPLILLQTPFEIPQNTLEFGVNAGVSTQIYGNAGKFSVAPVLGLSVRKNFDQNYAVQGELHYKLVMPQNMNQPFTNGNPSEMTMQVDIDPSAEVNYQSRNARVYGVKSMHIFEMPVSFIYELNNRHSVSMGLKMSYLQGVQTASSIINSLSKEQLGFSSLDLGALAGYEFKINNHFALGVFYNVGFLNLAKNTKQSVALYNDQFSGSYMLDASQQEEVLINDERMLPVQVDGDEQIFFQAPKNYYNTDLKVLIRYIF